MLLLTKDSTKILKYEVCILGMWVRGVAVRGMVASVSNWRTSFGGYTIEIGGGIWSFCAFLTMLLQTCRGEIGESQKLARHTPDVALELYAVPRTPRMRERISRFLVLGNLALWSALRATPERLASGPTCPLDDESISLVLYNDHNPFSLCI